MEIRSWKVYTDVILVRSVQRDSYSSQSMLNVIMGEEVKCQILHMQTDATFRDKMRNAGTFNEPCFYYDSRLSKGQDCMHPVNQTKPRGPILGHAILLHLLDFRIYKWVLVAQVKYRVYIFFL